MPDIATLAIFAVACLALTATPGADMLLIAARSASQGRLAGFLTLAGVQAGTYCHALVAAIGLSQVFAAHPLAYDAVRYAGAAYLLFLAWQAFRADAVIAAPSPDARQHAPLTIFRPGLFTQGLFTNVLNPKMVLFVLALFPQFVHPDAGSVVLQMLILATVLNVIGLIVNGAVILAAVRLRGALTGAGFGRGRYARWPQVMLGTVFTGLALRLAFDRTGAK